jgi:hypothetical protein
VEAAEFFLLKLVVKSLAVVVVAGANNGTKQIFEIYKMW